MASLFGLACLLAISMAARAEDVLPLERIVSLVRVSAGEVAEQLRREGVPVCFEEAPASGDISVKEAVAELEKVSASERTSAEKARLFTLATMLKNAPDTAVRLARLKRFNLDCAVNDKEPNPSKMLDALVAADPAYAWKKLGPRYVVYPREGSRLDQPVPAFTARGVAYPVLLATLNKEIFASWSLHCTGLFGSGDSDPKKKLYTFKLAPATGWELLRAVADQFGSRIVWVEQSSGEARTLYFTSVHLRAGVQPWN